MLHPVLSVPNDNHLRPAWRPMRTPIRGPLVSPAGNCHRDTASGPSRIARTTIRQGFASSRSARLSRHQNRSKLDIVAGRSSEIMTIQTVSLNRAYGGVQGVYKHASGETGTEMTFSV